MIIGFVIKLNIELNIVFLNALAKNMGAHYTQQNMVFSMEIIIHKWRTIWRIKDLNNKNIFGE